jgi:hypothetical protein
MTFTEQPRLLARLAGAFYMIIIVCALFGYLYVRGQVIVDDDMVQTASNMAAHEQLYRLGFSAAVLVVICNLPMGLLLYELLKVVNPRLALLALLFIIVSTTIEAVKLFNYIAPLFTLSMPEYISAFDAGERRALARGPIRMFGYALQRESDVLRRVLRADRIPRPSVEVLPADSWPDDDHRRRDLLG